MRRINYPAPLTTTLSRDAQQWTADELLQRTRFLNGTSVGLPGYGILDSRDPATVVEGSTRPFAITSTYGTFTISIAGGVAVFGNGEMISTTTISNITVPTTYLGQRLVVYLTFVEQGHDPRFGDDDVLVDTWTGYPDASLSYVRIALKTQYDALGVATTTATTIPLAMITPTNTGLIVDQSRAEFVGNRPWATAIDVIHRSYLGSGSATTRNPHALAVSDLSVTDGMTLYDFMLPHGIVLARDLAIAGVPGYSCDETITPLAITQDATGAITGVSGAYYFSATKFPTQVLKCVGVTSGYDIALVQVPARNILMFLQEDQWDTIESLQVTYMTVDAVAPPTGSNLVTFPAKAASTAETIVAGGVVLTSLAGDMSFSSVGAYPCNLEVYMDADGYLHRTPDTLKCDIALTDAVGTQTLDLQPVIPTKIRVGMRSAVANPLLDVQIEISGISDDDGLLYTEILAFDGSWNDSTIPASAENANQWLTTNITWQSIDSWRVLARSNDGPNSAVTFQALYDANNLALSSDLPIAEVFWDGLRMATIKDVRPIRISATDTRTVEFAASSVSFAETTLLRSTAVNKAVIGAWFEDFDQPMWVSSDSNIIRWSDGLGVSDVYISRPIPVRPNLEDAVSFRIWPVDTDQGFNGSVRFFTDTGGWTSWQLLSTLANPKYSYDFTVAGKLIKWQFQFSGPCKGMMAAYLAKGDVIPPTMIFDVGVFGVDSLG